MIRVSAAKLSNAVLRALEGLVKVTRKFDVSWILVFVFHMEDVSDLGVE
jgi:hypothetical protein